MKALMSLVDALLVETPGMVQAFTGMLDPVEAKRDETRLVQQRTQRRQLKVARAAAFTLLAVAAVVFLYAMSWELSRRGWATGVLLLLVLSVWILYFFSTSDKDDDIRRLEIEIEIKDDLATPAKAFRLFQLHQVELDRYYRHTLFNSRILMVVGLLCLVAGLGLVGGAAWFVWKQPTAGAAATAAAPGAPVRQVDWIVAALAAIGGILTNYVAAMFLKMHAAASQALNDFHNRLVSTHHLHFANFLVAKIDDQKTQEAALQKMGEEIARR